MNRKQFLLLVIALAILGGVGLAIFWKDVDDYRASGSKIGAKLLPGLKVADVALIELRDAKAGVTLVRKENHWVVQEREGYPADFKAISDLIIKLSDLKITQADSVGESLLPRVELVVPGKGDGSGTLVELKDAAGKTLQSVVLGRTVLKKDPGNPLPAAADGVPAGRYVRVLSGKEQVVVVSDPLTNAAAQPGRWLDKDFAKIERVKTLTVTGENGWKITRDLEWGQWKFAGGGGDLDASAAVGAVNGLGQLSFNDVVPAKPEDEGGVTTVVAETFDNLTYTLKFAKRKAGPDYLVNVSAAGEPPAAREIEKGDKEKPEDKERRDKDYAESRKRLELRVARDKARSAWNYVVEAKQIEPFLKSRAQMIAQRKPPPDDPRKR
ncbi:MAG TPA: DUF4340 domain-containing protein [Burkholderiales bacterium]|nr:DUF4340 domain-containing protein [Burkholderiales bacterium]